jgi:ribosomal protein RSM22 (predicted rRNA methylase)
MELPAALRSAVDRVLQNTPVAELQRASAILSNRYRAELRDGRLHLSEELAVKAYLAARLPATFAAIRASLSSVAEVQPDFAPKTLLDLGAGPGTALWAGTDCWPSIDTAVLVEASAAARAIGEKLVVEYAPAATTWLAGDVSRSLSGLKPADLVTLSYVLDELAPESIAPLIDRLWALTLGTLVIVEPGTPAGWQRILVARERLIAGGARLVAPCPHEAPCPLAQPDWCHFSRRVARSRIHRLTKEADVPWEDEKYIFVAATRLSVEPVAARVIAPPRPAKGRITLKLCRTDGSAAERLVSKREGAAFAHARRLDWGDAASLEIADGP